MDNREAHFYLEELQRMMTQHRGIFSEEFVCANGMAILALEQKRKEGRWIVVSDGYGNGEATACICECSECKDTIWVYKKAGRKWNYCPNCGAKMGGDAKCQK